MKFISTILLLISCFTSFSQDKNSVNSYFKPKGEATYALFTAGYRMPLYSKQINNSGQGIYIEAGFNPGKFIHKNMILAPYLGWAFRGSAWSTAFSEEFTHDYRSSLSYQDKNYSATEQTIIHSSAQLFEEKRGSSLSMPGCETNSFHNYALYYGLVFKLPVRYSPVLKLYAGSTRSYYMGNKIVSSDKDYNIFEFRRPMYGTELVFFRGLQLMKHINAGTLSVYYEYTNLKESSLYFDDGAIRHNLPVKDFTNSSFLQKHQSETTLGLRLAFSVM